MTENQRPEDPAYTVPPATPGTTGERSPGTYPVEAQQPAAAQQTTDTFGTSRKDAVKEEAGDVARTAADSAQSVAETAKAEATNVAAEAKANAKDLLYQARSDLTEQAGAQQQKVANGLRSVSDELHAMARASDQPGVATDLVRQAAERSSSIASWLDGRDPGSLLDEVKSFARQRPGTFLLLAAGAGVLAGRLSRGLSAAAPESATNYAGTRGQYDGGQYNSGYTPSSGGTVPPPSVELPGPATTTAGRDGGAPGSSYGESVRPASPLDSPQLAEQSFSTNRLANDPLEDRELADNPMGNDPLTRDRSADGQTGRP